MKTKTNQQIKEASPEVYRFLLPKNLVETVSSLKLTRINENHLLNLLTISWHDLIKAQTEYDYYSKWSVEYIRDTASDWFYKQVFSQIKNESFSEAEKKKRNNSIFESTGSYDVKKNQPKRYRINPALLNGELVRVEATIDLAKHTLNNEFTEIIEHFDTTKQAFNIDFERLERNLDDIINPILVQKEGIYFVATSTQKAKELERGGMPTISCKRLVYLNASLPSEKPISFKGMGKGFLESKLNERKEYQPEAVLFISDDQAYIGLPNEYFDRKKRTMLGSAKHAIESLNSNAIYRSISSKNGRMHTTISNLHSIILPFCSLEEHNIASLDLRNSQPCILGNLLMGNEALMNSIAISRYPKLRDWSAKLPSIIKPKIWGEFNDLIRNHDIYQLVADNSGSSRAMAKQEFMVFLFSAPGYNSPIAASLDKEIPGLSREIKAVKKFCIDSLGEPLAVVLQMTEAHIFIEHVLSRLSKLKIPVLTRHDSILFADNEERKYEVENVIEEVFSELGFVGEMKHSSHSVLPSNHHDFNSPMMNDYYLLHRYMESVGAREEIEEFLATNEGVEEKGEFDWGQFKTLNRASN